MEPGESHESPPGRVTAKTAERPLRGRVKKLRRTFWCDVEFRDMPAKDDPELLAWIHDLGLAPCAVQMYDRTRRHYVGSVKIGKAETRKHETRLRHEAELEEELERARTTIGMDGQTFFVASCLIRAGDIGRALNLLLSVAPSASSLDVEAMSARLGETRVLRELLGMLLALSRRGLLESYEARIRTALERCSARFGIEEIALPQFKRLAAKSMLRGSPAVSALLRWPTRRRTTPQRSMKPRLVTALARWPRARSVAAGA